MASLPLALVKPLVAHASIVPAIQPILKLLEPRLIYTAPESIT